MGSYGGAKTCELVACFLLSQFQAQFGQNLGLQREDGLGITDTSPRATETAAYSKKTDYALPSKPTNKLLISWMSHST